VTTDEQNLTHRALQQGSKNEAGNTQSCEAAFALPTTRLKTEFVDEAWGGVTGKSQSELFAFSPIIISY